MVRQVLRGKVRNFDMTALLMVVNIFPLPKPGYQGCIWIKRIVLRKLSKHNVLRLRLTESMFHAKVLQFYVGSTLADNGQDEVFEKLPPSIAWMVL